MVIGIDASAVNNRKGGASFYIVNIIRAIASVDKINRFYVFTKNIKISQFESLPENFKIIYLAPSNVFLRLIWEQTILPFFLCRQLKIEVLFSPNYTTPYFKPGFRSVVTIHDLSFFPLSKLYPLSRRLFRPIISLSVKTAKKIIAVSEFTRQDILKFVGPYSEKITVIYEAADKRFRGPASEKEIADIKEKFKIKGKYLLFTGFLEPRKNLERLLEAFTTIKGKIEHNLVIIGGNGWWYQTTYKKVKEFALESRVVFTGYVEDEELPALYSGADLFVFPSLYEGFGIAALESICCRTPVLASNNTALPEVVGDAGILIDPYNVDEIGLKILDLVNSPDKITRIKNNCEKVMRRFNWEKSAKETINLLTEN